MWPASSGNNWDLHAVVRGGSSSAAIDPFSSFPPTVLKEDQNFGGQDKEVAYFPELAVAAENALHELEELCRPSFAKPSSLTLQRSTPLPTQEIRQQSQRQKSKPRKSQQKKVTCQVPADGVSDDLWAWRKYGQKPIKGSPYPRGYYKCSSSKGCMARKQVERSRTDPSMLIITYTSDHDHPVPTHRNSLAGSTRNKFPPLTLTRAEVLSPMTPLTVSMEEELTGEDEMGQLADLEESHKGSVLAAVDSDDDDDDFVKSFFSSR